MILPTFDCRHVICTSIVFVLNGWDHDVESIRQTQLVCIVELLYKNGFNVGLFQLGYIKNNCSYYEVVNVGKG